tara:strand:- start:149 stop:397 length:249 start_codon:yes stop_codon:yes gene_type:complete
VSPLLGAIGLLWHLRGCTGPLGRLRGVLFVVPLAGVGYRMSVATHPASFEEICLVLSAEMLAVALGGRYSSGLLTRLHGIGA